MKRFVTFGEREVTFVTCLKVGTSQHDDQQESTHGDHPIQWHKLSDLEVAVPDVAYEGRPVEHHERD